jgi:pimeloyl-ACP methyl ester carboxylesterase
MMGDQSIKLSDGRSLGFQCLGDEDGSPLFFFHGTPGSRLVLSQHDLLAQVPGVRLIVPERPGYGISDPKPGRVLLDWPDDVAELADYLSLNTFAVAGGSGGGPHALACAYRLVQRVTMALVFSSPAPAAFHGATRGMSSGNRLGLLLTRYAPWLVRRMMRHTVALFERNPEGFLAAMAKQMAPPDRELLQGESFREAIIRDLRESLRQGSDGQAVDSALAMTNRDWGFDLQDISVPVFLWHGEEDALVSIHMAKYLAREIPRCDARMVPGAGHLLTDYPVVVEEVRKVLLGGAV